MAAWVDWNLEPKPKDWVACCDTRDKCCMLSCQVKNVEI